MATQVEAMGMRLLRGFDEEAKGNTETAVLAGKRPNEQASYYGSEDYEVALRHLFDSGYLRSTSIVGGEGYSITVAGKDRVPKGDPGRLAMPVKGLRVPDRSQGTLGRAFRGRTLGPRTPARVFRTPRK
jgi:hypothetical protein